MSQLQQNREQAQPKKDIDFNVGDEEEEKKAGDSAKKKIFAIGGEEEEESKGEQFEDEEGEEYSEEEDATANVQIQGSDQRRLENEVENELDQLDKDPEESQQPAASTLDQ